MEDTAHKDLAWLALAQMIDGRSCCFCGYKWESRADVLLREPIAASVGGKDLACQPCWNEGKRL